jgi:N-methylhydantoinase B
MHIDNRDCAPFVISPRFDRVHHPPRGRAGGMKGAAGWVGIASGPEFRPKSTQTVPAGDTLIIEMPGGAGHGDPRTREVWRVAEDVRNGIVTPQSARRDYGVAADRDGNVDETATARLRKAKNTKTKTKKTKR